MILGKHRTCVQWHYLGDIPLELRVEWADTLLDSDENEIDNIGWDIANGLR